MPKEHVNPTSLPNWSRSFSQVVVASGTARVVFTSGQVSVDANNEVVGAGDVAIQARTAFRNLVRALDSVGATVRDVVRLGIYVVDYGPEQATVIGDALRAEFGEVALPTSTWLGVQSLALDGLLIEVEAVAILE